MKTYAYRFYDQMYSGVSISPSGSESYYPIGPKIECHEYEIIKETPQGFWVALGFTFEGFPASPKMEKRWISNTSRKKFACRTRQEALESFRRRKRAQMRYLSHQLDIAERALDASKLINIDGTIKDTSVENPLTAAIL